MEISAKGLDLIKKFEGCKLKAYQDSVGFWTIGYGWTQMVEGKTVGPGMHITQTIADNLLRSGVEQYATGVAKRVRVPLTQNQFDALVSFAYNMGVKSLQSSELLMKLNASDYQGAADEFLRWVYAGGQELNGLVKRRTSERKLFLE